MVWGRTPVYWNDVAIGYGQSVVHDQNFHFNKIIQSNRSRKDYKFDQLTCCVYYSTLLSL